VRIARLASRYVSTSASVIRSRLSIVFVATNRLPARSLRSVHGAPYDFAYMLEDVDVTIGLAHVFVAYRLRSAEEREKQNLRMRF
jgi:hypothetical protein